MDARGLRGTGCNKRHYTRKPEERAGATVYKPFAAQEGYLAQRTPAL